MFEAAQSRYAAKGAMIGGAFGAVSSGLSGIGSALGKMPIGGVGSGSGSLLSPVKNAPSYSFGGATSGYYGGGHLGPY
jgi:hypothetical protein